MCVFFFGGGAFFCFFFLNLRRNFIYRSINFVVLVEMMKKVMDYSKYTWGICRNIMRKNLQKYHEKKFAEISWEKICRNIMRKNLQKYHEKKYRPVWILLLIILDNIKNNKNISFKCCKYLNMLDSEYLIMHWTIFNNTYQWFPDGSKKDGSILNCYIVSQNTLISAL